MAKINLKYSRRLNALVLKPGKRDVIDHRTVARLKEIEALELLQLWHEDDSYRSFYYKITGYSSLDTFMSQSISRVQYRTMLTSLLSLMELCVRENLAQGNVCFDASYIYAEHSGALHFAYIPFERVMTLTSPLDLLLYISGPKTRLVLPEDKVIVSKVADFAQQRSVLTASDFASFLRELFTGDAATFVPISLDTREVSADSLSARVEDMQSGDVQAMTLDPVFILTGSSATSAVSSAVSAKMMGSADPYSFSETPKTTVLSTVEEAAEDNRQDAFTAQEGENRALKLARMADGVTFALPTTPVVLGRSESCDIVVSSNSAVSRRHAVFDGDTLMLTDLGSANGTFIGDERLASGVPASIALGEEFVLGNETFAVVEQ